MSTDTSAWADSVRPKVTSGPVPLSTNQITSNGGNWQPGMTLFNFDTFSSENLADMGLVTVPSNNNAGNFTTQNDQTADTTAVMKQTLQQSAENAKNDSTVNQNNSTINQVDAFSNIENFETKFVFPYNTAEKVKKNGYFKQPYSYLVGILTTLMIFYFLLKTKTIQGFFLIFSLLLFEVFHTYSHMVHLKDIMLQTKIVHNLTIFVNLSLLFALCKYSNKDVSKYFVLFIIFVVIADYYALNNLSVGYYVLTQLIILFSILFYYLKYITKIFNIKLLFALFLIIYLGFINETINGKYLLEKYPQIPFHSILELLLFGFFYVLCSSLYKI